VVVVEVVVGGSVGGGAVGRSVVDGFAVGCGVVG
jgi:hypothetical protein